MKLLNTKQIEELIYLEKSIDEVLINELIEIYNAQLTDLIHLINDFFNTANKTYEISPHLNTTKMYEISSLSHKLKSSAGNLGLLVPFQICLELETESKKLASINYREKIIFLSSASKEALLELDNFIKAS